MMKNKAFLLIILSAFMTAGLAQSALATPHVENISLKKQGDFVELTVYSDGPFTFSHFIEEAKAGKPHRVVLDLKQCLHKLPQFNFRDLPTDIITAIRTSQYKINPDKVVRIVADVSRPVTYSLKQGEGRVTIVFSAPSEGEFSFWTAAPMDESEKIKLALTETETKVIDQPASMPAHPETEKTARAEGEFNPPSNTNVDSKPETGFSAAERQELKAKMAEILDEGSDKAGTEPDKKVQAPVKPSPQSGNLASADDKKTTTRTDGDKAVKPEKPESGSRKVISDSQAVTPSEPVKVMEKQPDQTPEPKKPGSTQDDQEQNKPKDWESEKELRQNPTRPTKVKGSLAASFPQREVIRYQSFGRRDPFMPLVSENLKGFRDGEMPDVETLRLVGVLRGNYDKMVLLEDVEGYGYILQNGDKVRNGYVIEIYSNKVLFQISEFGWSRTVALTMELEDED
ncbi:MAG TPA: hypothetical protein ENO22_06760 [candidate division Zixibacteria bacterium]|nr:hypothetical protein [candidate division Zixibacteria bacterium]